MIVPTTVPVLMTLSTMLACPITAVQLGVDLSASYTPSGPALSGSATRHGRCALAEMNPRTPPV